MDDKAGVRVCPYFSPLIDQLLIVQTKICLVLNRHIFRFPQDIKDLFLMQEYLLFASYFPMSLMSIFTGKISRIWWLFT